MGRTTAIALVLLSAGVLALVAACSSHEERNGRIAVGSSGTVVREPNFDSSTFLQMTSASTGWLGWTSATRQGKGGVLAVARSADQGRTWVNVTPLVKLGGETLSLVPMGSKTAFFVAVRPGKTATVYVTHDGGKTWAFGRPVTVRSGQDGAHLSSHGRDVWLEVGGPRMSRSASAQLLMSKDGGYTWHLVAETGTRPPAVGALPGYSWIVFTSDKVGFTSAETPKGGGDSAEMYRTTDAGKTWAVEPVSGFWLSIGPPRFSGNDGLAEIFPVSEMNPVALLVGTTDAGKKWTYRGGAIATTADVVSGETAVAADWLGNVDRTTNGGRTWQKVSSPASERRLPQNKQIGRLSFVSAKVGWAIITPKANPNVGEALYLTTDGGATWQDVAR